MRKYKKKKKFRAVMGFSVAILVLLFILSFFLGRYPISPAELIGILASRIFPVEVFWKPEMEVLLFQMRLPRILLACLVGCSLSAAGASYQGIFQNPMASPDILGASSGAAFGAAFAILLGGESWQVTLSAFAFGILTVVLALIVSRRSGGSRVLSLILVGMMVSSLFSAGTSFIKLVADPNNQLPAITYWLMGSLSGTQLKEVGLVCIPMAVGILPLLLLRWRINIITLGDDEARSIGVNAGRIRMVIILMATLLTAASVSVSGMIGWVGLVIPHLARRLVGDNYMRLMPASMVIGAAFLLAVDDVSRNLLTTQIPIGILTAVIGVPFFLYLFGKRKEIS